MCIMKVRLIDLVGIADCGAAQPVAPFGRFNQALLQVFVAAAPAREGRVAAAMLHGLDIACRVVHVLL
jgi:hypothetical protein